MKYFKKIFEGKVCRILFFSVLFFLPISITQAIINIPEEARRRSEQGYDISELSIARNIADNIMHIARGHRSQFEMGLDNVMRDHSENHHGREDTYFRTDDRNIVKSLINLVIANPSGYEVYTFTGRDERTHYRLMIRKTLSVEDVQRIMHHDNLGRKGEDIYLNHIVVIFAIDGVETLSDSLQHGNFLTAFPAREDYFPPR